MKRMLKLPAYCIKNKSNAKQECGNVLVFTFPISNCRESKGSSSLY